MCDEFRDIAPYYDELYVKPGQYQDEAEQVVALSRCHQQSVWLSASMVRLGL